LDPSGVKQEEDHERTKAASQTTRLVTIMSSASCHKKGVYASLPNRQQGQEAMGVERGENIKLKKREFYGSDQRWFAPATIDLGGKGPCRAAPSAARGRNGDILLHQKEGPKKRSGRKRKNGAQRHARENSDPAVRGWDSRNAKKRLGEEHNYGLK